MKILILAGGSGTRLWPISRTEFPKQFLRIGEDKSLLQRTISRCLNLVKPDEVFVITTKSLLHIVKEQLDELHPSLKENILLEPAQRNTAPAILYALKELVDQRGIAKEETVLVVPCDHVIAPEIDFVTKVKRGEECALRKKIVTLGIKPTHPEVGYGYIEAKESFDREILHIARFVEKPNQETASSYIASGNFFWNSGMFLFQIETMLEEFRTCEPEFGPFLNLESEQLRIQFEKIKDISIDYAVMEKTQKGVVLPLDLFWSDVGSWENVYEILPKDENQNAKTGQIIDIDTENSLILGNQRLIVTIGLKNMLVIETPDALLISPKEASQKVKEVISQLKKRGRKEIREHVTTHRPWGSFTVLGEGTRYKIKKIEVNPNETLSLQMHHHRSEHWVVVKGIAKVQIGDQESFVHENESIYVPKGAVHRVHNPGKIPLEIIETQVGEYLGEDDIIRLEDIYGR